MTTRLLATLCATTLLAVSTTLMHATPATAQTDPGLQQTVEADEQIAPEGERTVISAGHVDLGPQVIDGELKFLARDDTSVPPVWRSIDDVVFEVGQASAQTLPEEAGNEFDFTGAQPGDTVWAVPQTEVASLPWLGWNTQAPSLQSLDIDRGVTLEFAGHQGPGQFSLFLQNGGFEPPQVLWNSAAEGTQPLFVDMNTHTHANWVFTEPGVHLVGIRVVVPLVDGTERIDERVVRFAVGNTAPEEAFATSWDTSSGTRTDSDTVGDTDAESAESQDSELPVVWIGIGLAVVGVLAAIGAAAVGSKNSKRKQAAAALKEDK
ncbi:choice-of-anchor M domain-containing protein [Corynebacterium pilosum]|uniref:Putative secreted protein n=1 Tax=Corynebacterium pilosum TaxID=35756 RepID=A0A376CP87_9CORY|nr:choice-of-anchor M domain-containing protein [Corynebacterium pilosum]STC70301.1 putative secreted protein [Corynebacterium pilosum]